MLSCSFWCRVAKKFNYSLRQYLSWGTWTASSGQAVPVYLEAAHHPRSSLNALPAISVHMWEKGRQATAEPHFTVLQRFSLSKHWSYSFWAEQCQCMGFEGVGILSNLYWNYKTCLRHNFWSVQNVNLVFGGMKGIGLCIALVGYLAKPLGVWSSQQHWKLLSFFTYKIKPRLASYGRKYKIILHHN